MLAEKNELDNKVYAVYISPLKALGNDIHKNLIEPLDEIYKLAEKKGIKLQKININIKTTAITLTPAISDYTNKRLEKIMHLLDNDKSAVCDVELAKTTGHHQKGNIFKAEVHIVGAGKNYYASSERPDLFAAIDLVRDEITHEISAGKAKRISLIRRSGARVKNMVKGLWPWRNKTLTL